MPRIFTNDRSYLWILIVLSVVAPACAEDRGPVGDAGLVERLASEQPFIDENNAAMFKMMSEMEIKPTGDVDADFAAMMIAHHRGAIAMALAELRYGRNEKLRRIAQEIVIEQQQEIMAMQLALGQPLSFSAVPSAVATSSSVPREHSAAKHHHRRSSEMSDPAMSSAEMKGFTK
ncbi:DUF305 domain-containing protein [Tardiphaga alba]|uniref:DUF305 domain-containing protein n=2 Tax=Tardiphaga alba TaxID=340268 RepID=A0ABX8AI19_9BRAD|nr:DUF305 domain-containing protein [Tardiphaga alba]